MVDSLWIVRGALKVRNHSASNKMLPLVTDNLIRLGYKHPLLLKSSESRESRNNWYKKIQAETIDYKTYSHFISDDEFQSKASASRQAELNMRLVEGIWEYQKDWAKKFFNKSIKEVCKISVKKRSDMSLSDAWGVFRFNEKDCEIEIAENCVYNTNLLLLVLAHEYVHYIHYKLVDYTDYCNCPNIFCEGLAEVGARMFYEFSKYQLREELKKSWNESYEIARCVVNQIISEGFNLETFKYSFLMNVPHKSSWSDLNKLFEL